MALAILANASGIRRATVHARGWSRQLSKGPQHSEQELLDVAAHESQVAARLAQMFRQNPDEAAKLVSGSLSTQQRAELLCLLCRDSSELTAHTNKRLQALRVLCPHVLSAR
jgi:predicted alpha/beta hydrolase